MVLNGHVLQILLGIEKDSSVLFGLYFTNILSHLVSDTIWVIIHQSQTVSHFTWSPDWAVPCQCFASQWQDFTDFRRCQWPWPLSVAATYELHYVRSEMTPAVVLEHECNLAAVPLTQMSLVPFSTHRATLISVWVFGMLSASSCCVFLSFFDLRGSSRAFHLKWRVCRYITVWFETVALAIPASAHKLLSALAGSVVPVENRSSRGRAQGLAYLGEAFQRCTGFLNAAYSKLMDRCLLEGGNDLKQKKRSAPLKKDTHSAPSHMIGNVLTPILSCNHITDHR